jgi:hypothetical protein
MDFLGFLGKRKTIEEKWKAVEENRKPLKKIKFRVRKIGF